MSEQTVWWAANWRCPKCGATVDIEPGQDTRLVEAAHTCDLLALKRAEREESTYALDLTDAPDEHECVFVEEQEPSGRLILPPCIVCGFTAMDALEQMRGEHA